MLRGEGAPVEDIPVPRVDSRPQLERGFDRDFERGGDRGAPRGKRRGGADDTPEPGMQRYRLEVGKAHGAKAGNILGAIANEAGLKGADIGRILLFDEYSTVDLPEGMPKDMFQHLKKVRVAGRPLSLSLVTPGQDGGDR